MKTIENIKIFLRKILPSYRVSLRMEEQLYRMEYSMKLMSKRQEMIFWWLLRDPNETLSETQHRFFISLPKAEGRLREIQILLLNLLKQFDEICRENDVDYWLEAGSLLGAVRHKGFVPWDDDLDVGITRKNFNKLYDIIKDNTSMEMKFQYDLKKNYCFPKLFIKNSKISLWLDFIIYDEIECKYWEDVKKRWNKRMILKEECKKILERSLIFNHVDNDLFTDIKNITILKDTFIDYASKLVGTDKDTNYLMVSIEFPDDMCTYVRCFPKKWVYPLKNIKFDEIDLYVPQEAEKYLVALYGDFYSLPLDAGTQRHINFEELLETIKGN